MDGTRQLRWIKFYAKTIALFSKIKDGVHCSLPEISNIWKISNVLAEIYVVKEI